MKQKTENSRKCDNMLCCGFPTLSTRRLQSNFHQSCVFAQVVQQAVSVLSDGRRRCSRPPSRCWFVERSRSSRRRRSTSQAETWAADDETASVAKSNANSRVNNCELGILANVKLPATSEYPTLSTKYYIYELYGTVVLSLMMSGVNCGLLSGGLLSVWPFVRIPNSTASCSFNSSSFFRYSEMCVFCN